MSSLRGRRRKACNGKVKHATDQAARFAIYEMRKARRLDVSGLQSYRCPFCGSWHVGHFRKRG